MKYLLAIISVILIAGFTYAQKLTVKGSIRDSRTGKTLQFANLRVDNSTMGAATDINGNYEIKLLPGNYTLIASYLGYISDTIKITLKHSLDALDFELDKSPVVFPEVFAFPDENPANGIIRRAIKAKKERDKKLFSYEFDAYTKGVIKTQNEIDTKQTRFNIGLNFKDTSSLKVSGIIENQSKGYFKKPGNYKEFIIARKQTANFPSYLNILTGPRVIQNFYDDDVNFFGRNIPGPLADNALDYYDFSLNDFTSINNKSVYEISMETKNDLDPGFSGIIYITDEDYNLLQINLELNRAANPGGIFERIALFQQFSSFADSIYMPVDYRVGGLVNYLGIAKVGFELNSILYDYKINNGFDDDIFDNAILTVLPLADEKDSTYWANIQYLPYTKEELNAYNRIDSLTSAHQNFWQKFSPLSSKYFINDNYSVSAPLGMYHFNRVEGNTVRFDVNAINLFNNRFHSSLGFAYGFADLRVKSDLKFSYYFGKYRTFNISANVFNKLNILFGKSDSYRNLTSTILALVTKYEFRNYYYSKGFELNTAGEITPRVKLRAGYSSITDKTASTNSDFSFFSRHKTFSNNLPVLNTKINYLSLGLTLDPRKYIEDGYYRRRITGGKSFITFDADVHFSRGSFLNSAMNFTTYEFSARGLLRTFDVSGINFRFYGLITAGKLPVQYLYSLPGNINAASQGFSFRTLNIGEIVGDNVFSINIEHNLGNKLFKWLNIPGIKNWDIGLNLFFNAAYTEISDESKSLLTFPVKTFNSPFYEIGFGLGHVLLPFRIDFGWKLNHRGENNFRIGFNTFLF